MRRWACRLQAIARRAGDFSKPAFARGEDGILTYDDDEKFKLNNLVMMSGAPSTMAGRVRRFENFELWADRNQVSLYPITIDKAVKYGVYLDDGKCGPTVLPSLRSSLKWVAFRTGVEVPSLNEALFITLEKKVSTERGKSLKEAAPFTVNLVTAMEAFVVDSAFEAARIFLWWVLCMIFASFWFDAAVHACQAARLEVTQDGIFGAFWQTKTESKRRGAKFLVPDVGFPDRSWLTRGIEGFRKLFPGKDADRDFWVPHLSSKTSFGNRPPEQRSRKTLIMSRRSHGTRPVTLLNMFTRVDRPRRSGCRPTGRTLVRWS